MRSHKARVSVLPAIDLGQCAHIFGEVSRRTGPAEELINIMLWTETGGKHDLTCQQKKECTLIFFQCFIYPLGLKQLLSCLNRVE